MKTLLKMAVVLLLLAGGALSNPSEDRHQEAIAAQYNAQNPISGALGAGRALAALATYENRVFFSTTRIGEERISTGFLGRVDVRSLDLADLPDLIIERLPDDARWQLDR